MVSPRMTRLSFLTAGILIGGALVVWASDILAPFVVAFILAYLCDPLAGRMERLGMPRSLACIIIVAALVLLCVGVIAILGPIVYGQFQSLLRALPDMIDGVMERIRHEILPVSPFPVAATTSQPAASGMSFAPLASSVLSGGLSMLPKIGLALLTPVITYYLLKDWPKLVAQIFAAIPDGKGRKAHEMAAEIDSILSGFLRGQAWVCTTIAIVYASGLVLSGLSYGLVIGIFAGFMKYLPYIGTAIGLLLAVMTGLAQEGSSLALMGGIGITFLVAEFLESSILTPRLVGDRVKVAPAMVIFAVLMGGKLMGVLGVFLAVPIYATLRLFLREALARDEADAPS